VKTQYRIIAPDSQQQRSIDVLCEFANLPFRERLTDRLADAMIAIDEAMQLCEMEGDETRDASLLAPQILAAYDQVNCIMKTICN
jgi:hypothetical protein